MWMDRGYVTGDLVICTVDRRMIVIYVFKTERLIHHTLTHSSAADLHMDVIHLMYFRLYKKMKYFVWLYIAIAIAFSVCVRFVLYLFVLCALLLVRRCKKEKKVQKRR